MCPVFAVLEGKHVEGRNCPLNHPVFPTLVMEMNDDHGKKTIPLPTRGWGGRQSALSAQAVLMLTLPAHF